MRTTKFERLKPGEILAERERKSIAYLAFGPLEWHGPHLPFGTDPLMAYSLALMLAEKTGGVVMPPVYSGTERERSRAMIAAFGIENPDQYVIGMDTEAVTVPSLYFREEAFAITLREYIRLLVKLQYKLIVLVNGHGAYNQIETVKRLAVEFSAETPSKVIDVFVVLSEEEGGIDPGHATKLETSMVLSQYPEDVDCSVYPPRNVPLKYKDYSIADDSVFLLKPSKDFTVEHDPRDATAELGKSYFKKMVEKYSAQIEDEYRRLP
jgi:creatinine amidohydrolase